MVMIIKMVMIRVESMRFAAAHRCENVIIFQGMKIDMNLG